MKKDKKAITVPANQSVTDSGRTLANKIADTLIGYAKTQLIIIVIVTGISWLALSLLQVRFALLLAIITGTLSVVPTLGMITASIIACLVAIFDGTRFLAGPSFLEGLVILLLFVILNFLIDLFVSPYLMGKSAKIHPLLLFAAVLIGSALFGFLGAFLAIPVLLVGNTIKRHYDSKN